MENNTPLSRVEDILQSTIDNTEYNKPPQSRVESLLIELKEVIGGGGSSAYHAAGSVDYVSELPSPSADYLGYVYDITQDFTTTSDFKEGAGKRYPAGSNIAIVDVGTPESPSYKYDVLSGFIDTSNFVEKEEGKGLSTNDYTDADKTKLSGIAEGAEVNVQSDWNESDNSSDAYIQNKPTLGTASALNVAESGNAGNNEVVKGNDSRLTDDRNPTPHTHAVSQITDFPTLGTAAGLNVPVTGDASSSEVVKGNDSRVVNSPIAKSVTGINPAITDSADGLIQDVKVYGRSRVSKNLLNYDAWKTTSITNGTAVWENNGVTLTATADDCYTMFYGADFSTGARVPVKENQIITLSWNESTDTPGDIYIFPNGGLTGYVQASNSETKQLSYTVPNGVTFITYRFGVATSGNTISYKNIQLELGSTPTPYEPYGIISIGDGGSLTIATTDNTASSTATLTTELPLCGVPVDSGETYTDGDGVKWLADTADVEGVVKRCYKITLDGSEDENWQVYSGSATGEGSKRIDCDNALTLAIISHNDTSTGLAIAAGLTLATPIQVHRADIENSVYVGSSGGYNTVGVRVSGIGTVSALRTYLASNPITIVYALATPTKQELTSAELAQLRGLKTYNSTTNVTVTDDPTSTVGYLLNTNNGQAVADVQNDLQGQIDEKVDEADLATKETKSVVMSYDEYTALATKDPDTSYYIPDAPDNWIFGYDIDNDDENPDTRVSYPADVDNTFFTPAYMDFTNDIFRYGNWNFKPGDKFMPRPCMLKYDETVDYYLDPDDDTKKADGTASDVADTTYGGNAEMEWNKIYTKRWEENGIYHFRCSNIKWDADWDCWCNYDKNDNVIPHFYTPIYFGSSDGTRLRSLSGQSNSVNTTAPQEIDLAKANSDGCFTEVTADWMLICDLLVMMCKSTNIQAKYGSGRSKSTNTSAINTGTMDTKGMFWGSNDETSGVKLFGMENVYGNIWRRIAGYMYVDGTQKLKITRGTHDGSTATDYNTTGDGYIAIPNSTITGASGNCIISMKSTPYGRIPSTLNGTASTNECDGTWYNNSETKYALVGGNWGDGLRTGPFYVAVSNAPSFTASYRGASLSCKPIKEVD